MKNLKMNQQHQGCMVKEKEHLYKIGMFANMNRVTIKTLRYYGEQKLLTPVYVDEENGYRYYGASQIADLHRILALKNMGFSIEDIRSIINGEEEKTLLLRKKQEILKEIAALTIKLAEVESYLEKENMDLSAPVLIKKIPEVIVCTMEQRIEAYDVLFQLMPEMGAEMERLGCICAEPEYCFTHYLEPGYKEEAILVEVCQAVTEKKPDTDKVTFKVLPEVSDAACIFHKGSYDTIHRSYAVLLNFIEENGYEICGNIRESYIDGVWNKDTEEEWLTEIQIPVRKVS
ncbi:MAG: MerR family transcriptional regulator [Lachnospiraceae bacterium]